VWHLTETAQQPSRDAVGAVGECTSLHCFVIFFFLFSSATLDYVRDPDGTVQLRFNTSDHVHERKHNYFLGFVSLAYLLRK
jgi:hypothetical protein